MPRHLPPFEMLPFKSRPNGWIAVFIVLSAANDEVDVAGHGSIGRRGVAGPASTLG